LFGDKTAAKELI